MTESTPDLPAGLPADIVEPVLDAAVAPSQGFSLSLERGSRLALLAALVAVAAALLHRSALPLPGEGPERLLAALTLVALGSGLVLLLLIYPCFLALERLQPAPALRGQARTLLARVEALEWDLDRVVSELVRTLRRNPLHAESLVRALVAHGFPAPELAYACRRLGEEDVEAALDRARDASAARLAHLTLAAPWLALLALQALPRLLPHLPLATWPASLSVLGLGMVILAILAPRRLVEAMRVVRG